MRCAASAWDAVLDTFMWVPPEPSYEADEPWLRTTPGGETYGFWGEPAFSRPLVLWLHGNAGDLGGAAFLEALATALEAVVVAPEYAGFGPGGGSPSLARTLAACRSVYAHVAALPSSQVVLVGLSMGTGIAMELQRDRPPDRIVLLAPFLSCLSLVARPLAAALPCLDRLRSYEAVADVRCPVLIVHGANDEDVPTSHGAELNDLVPYRHRRDFVRVPDVGHDLLRRWDAYAPTIRRFLAEY